jgi:hypothetical protein
LINLKEKILTGISDQIWLSVKREINSATVRHIEVITTDYRGASPIAGNMVFFDSAKTFIKSGIGSDSVVTNLGHLEGETVQVFKGNFYVGTKTVASSQITLDTSDLDDAEYVSVGLGYVADLETVPMEQGSRIGTAEGAIKRIDNLAIRFFDTASAKFGITGTSMDAINFRLATQDMADPIPAFSGIKYLQLSAGPDREASVLVRSDTPHPCGIASVTMRAEVYE